MKAILQPKNKIIQRTRQNLLDRQIDHKFENKKWKRFLRFNSKPIRINSFYKRRPRSLKHLYKERLLTRQKVKYFYGGLSDKKFKKLFKNIKQKNFSIDHLFIQMERQLDVLLFRSQLFFGLFEAQQKIKHKQIKVNGEVVKTTGYILEPGDYIEIPSNVAQYNNNRLRLPTHLGWDSSSRFLHLIHNPKIEDILYSFSINKNLIFEYLNNK